MQDEDDAAASVTLKFDPHKNYYKVSQMSSPEGYHTLHSSLIQPPTLAGKVLLSKAVRLSL